ncbi:CrcB protein [Stackebrandtia albiflava]|uniref:Fluoride-specific ion channel FluC n=1 Tax=Stackebrandtia albiflava TaxID=406432 RepID=A0A562V1V6_9ACTN|nr:CrcB family protein [Stackebrandtia albiflava]TWJ11900.1 CrcB protein [Stackebrandtia albiflava]
MTVLAIVIGAAIGGPLRYWADHRLHGRGATGFPWGVMLVNCAGAFGLAAVVAAGASGVVATGVTAGLFGALTTFSTFADQTLRLWREGAPRAAVWNVVLSSGAGIAAVVLGDLTGRLLADLPLW